MSESQIARPGIGRKFQRPTVFEDQIGQRKPDDGAEAPAQPVGRAVLPPVARRSCARGANWPRKSGWPTHLHRKAGELSHGQKQWLEIGMLLAQEPRLLLVDEPAAGMTLAEREHTTALLVEAAKTRAVVVVEHDMDFVRRLDCRVTVLHEGSVLAEGTPRSS